MYMYMYVTIRQLSQAACLLGASRLERLLKGAVNKVGDNFCDYQYLKHIQCIYMYMCMYICTRTR